MSPVSILEHAPQCTTRLNVPAKVIELGGLNSNYVLARLHPCPRPNCLSARRDSMGRSRSMYKRIFSQLLVVNLLPFWVDKYKRIFS